MSQLVLSLFPGIGLLDRAFEEAGFCIVRGPDVIWGGDVRNFNPPSGKFDGVIGGPPCQEFSSLANLVRASGREVHFKNMIPEYERCVRAAAPAWFLMENVRAAPTPVVPGYSTHDFMLCNSWLPSGDGYGQEQMRKRRFTFGLRGSLAIDLRRWIDQAVFLRPDRQATQTQWTPDNSPEAKTIYRHEAVTGGHDKPPSRRIGNGKVEYRERTGAVTAMQGSESRMKVRDATVTSSDGSGRVYQRRYKLTDACQLQGLPENFLSDAPFTAEGKLKAVANGVPLPMGYALAKAVKAALQTFELFGK